MRRPRGALNKLWRDLQRARETYRYRTYFWSRFPPQQIARLLIGNTYVQGNAKRRGARARISKFFLWSVRGRQVSALRALGHDVPTELAHEHVRYPFRFGTLFKWAARLDVGSHPPTG